MLVVGLIATDAAYDFSDKVGGTSTTVYCAISESTLSTYTLKLNVNFKGDGNDWHQYTMTNSGKRYKGDPIYTYTFTDAYNGLGCLQFQLYNGNTHVGQNELFNSWTGVGTYNGKMHVYGGSGWIDYKYDNWHIAGDSALMGSSWNTSADAMTYSGGNYVLTKSDVSLSAGSYEYKAINGTSWNDTTIPSGNTNNTLTISETGVYNVTFTVNGAGTTLSATASPVQYTVTYSLGTHVNKGTISGGTDSNGTITAYKGSNVVINVTYDSGYTYDSANSSLGGATASNSNKTFTFSSISGNKTISIAAKSSLTPLSAPSTVTLNGSAANCTVSTTTVGAKIRLAWSSVTNAGSYKIYKGDTEVTTVTGQLYYDIERANSYSGAYSVVAVPSNTNLYSESPKSTARTLTVNKSRLNTPTLSVSPTSIKNGDPVSLTVTDTNTSFTASEFGYYYYTGNAVTISNDYLMTPGFAKTLYPTSNTTYKACVYPNGGENNDYYLQSYTATASTVNVYTPAYYLVGDLVDSTNNKWNTSLQDYPVDEYVSPNVFKRTVTYASGGTNDKHHFRLNNGTNQYTVTNGTDTNMATHTTSSTAVTASTATTSGSMYVTGQGTYTIYVNQATGGSPKVWVEKTEPQKYTTIVYVNKDSGATNMYVWKDANNAVSPWPGEDITTTEETVNDITYYKYTFESYWDHFDIVVNKGNGNNQSADLTNIAANKTYYVIWDGGATTTASISETAPVIQLGYKVQNSSSNNHADFSSLTRSVTVSLAANTTYEFWLKSANSHLNDENAGTMTRANCTSWHFPVNNTNTKIQADLAGTYTFTYTVTNGEIYVSVTYPPEPKYSVTVNQGDHGTVKVNGSSFASGNTIQVGSLTTASIEAVPASGYHFTGWTTSGGVAAVSGYTTSSNPITITASATGSITATYAEDSYTLTLASAGNGSITTPSSKTLTVHPITATSLSGVTVSPANGYEFNGWTAGTGVTLTDGSSSSASTGSIIATQNSTLTANFTKINYTLTGKTSLNGTEGNYGTVTFYSNAACTSQITTAQIGNTVYAKFASDDYALVSFSKSGTGSSGGTTTGNVYSFTMGYANTTVTAAVRPLTSVTYYVDMHDNSMSDKTVEVAIVTNGGGTTVAKDGSGNDCKANLTQQGSSTVYAASVKTPTTQSDGSYSDVYVRVTYTGKPSATINIPGTKVATLVSTHEMWLEAENEASTPLTVNYATRSTPSVADGYRRIYVAKPYSWETSETNWATLGIYHWGEYTDIGWSNGIRMNYLGNSGSDGYHYYYADIPKALASNGTTVVTDGTGNKVSNIIFQGWNSTNPAAGTSPNAQTGNIENIPDSANFYILSKDGNAFVGTKSEEDAVIANYTRYVSSVTMNKTESTEVNIKPTYTGEDITYTSGNTSVVTVDSNGKITPQGRGTTNITVKIYGTIGSLLTTEDNYHKDYITYPVSVTVKDPTQFNGFEPMSFESKTYTVNIPTVSGDQPGYFDMSNVVMTVEGIRGVASSTSSAIITQTSTASVSGIGTVCTAFTVKYAKANTDYTNYNGIHIIGKTVTKSIRRTDGQRYGHDHWTEDGTTKTYTTSRVIDSGVETATTEGIPFDDTKETYSDIFAAYSYVDVTFTFNYYEYKPKKVDADGNVVADNVEGMIQYPYDSTWAGGEVTSNANFAASHTQKTFTVSNYEVRGKTADNITTSDLATAAATAIGVMPSNNYYTYSIAAANTTKTKTGTYTANSTVNMTQNVRNYSVYLNGSLVRNNYTYQEYAEPSVQNPADWYAVDDRNSTDTTNAPLLATGVNSYKFRVKGDTYLRTKTATNPRGYDFIRSEVDFSHYEVVHRENPQHNVVDYLMQNFYIADFFSPSEVLDPNSYSGKGKFGPAYKVETVTESTSTSSGNITVYFTDSLDWNDIHIYYWGENINNVNWPGSVMTQYKTDGDGKKIYSAEIPGTAEGVIFTGNNNQTVDITNNIANGSHWKSKNEIVRNGIPYDDAQFVGGGVVYYSMNGATEYNQGTPFASAVSSGYVNGDSSSADYGKINDTAIKEILKSNIEAQYAKDNIAGTVGEEDAMKAAYGTEIAATKNVEGGFNTGIIYRYLPLNQYKRDGSGNLETDREGKYTLTYDVNKNTFRYSNSLQSYQYVYASGNENKATNAGKNMRLYSYYVYSYVTYDQETNVPVTKYEIVLSDNYSDASTYWEGNPNPDPSN